MMRYVVILVLVLFLNKSEVTCIECYICSAVDDPASKCATNPAELEGISSRKCDKKYCTTFRIDYLDPKDKLASIQRTCADEPPCPLGISEDSTFRYYCMVCQTDICNNGDGRSPSNDNGLIKIDDGFGTLRVPGRGSAKQILPLTSSIFLTAIIILYNNLI